MLTTMGDAGCPGVLVPYEGQCLCPKGYYPDPRPQFKGVCVPSTATGFMSSAVEGVALLVNGRTDIMPGSIGVPGAGGAPGLATMTSAGAAPAGRGRLLLWLAIGGVAVTAGVLLLKRR